MALCQDGVEGSVNIVLVLGQDYLVPSKEFLSQTVRERRRYSQIGAGGNWGTIWFRDWLRWEKATSGPNQGWMRVLEPEHRPTGEGNWTAVGNERVQRKG